MPFAWFTADETYEQAKWLQAWLEEKDIWYVMAIRCSDTLTTAAGERRADALIAAVPARAWQISAGAGAHGPREYHWVRLPVRPGWERGRGHWLLARRSISDPAEIAYYACCGPRRSSTADLAWTAGSRWHIEECIQQAKGEAGLDHYQVRDWRGLVRPHHLVHARPGLARRQPGPGGKKGAGISDPGMTGYTLAELRRLLNSLAYVCSPEPDGRLVLVPLAPATPVPGPALSLPATRLRTRLKCQERLIGAPGRAQSGPHVAAVTQMPPGSVLTPAPALPRIASAPSAGGIAVGCYVATPDRRNRLPLAGNQEVRHG